MASDSEITKALIGFIDKRVGQMSLVCNVVSVDLAKLTCYCSPINEDADILDVRLMAQVDTGFLIVPKVDSSVVVTFIDDENAYVAMYSGIQEIRLNGIGFGGLIKIDSLKTQWDTNVAAIKSAVGAALAVIDTQLTALGQPGGAATAFNGSATSISNFNKTPAENTTVKHGNGT